MSPTLKRLLEAKHIGYFAGVCFIFNAVSGPAIPYTAANFQNPGLIFTSIAYILITALAGFCNLFLIESMQAIPGNKYFQGDIEFSTLINFFFGPKLHFIGQIWLYFAFQSNTIQCLLLTAQATDQFLVFIAGSTCGFTLKSFSWVCVSLPNPENPSPFGDTLMFLTIGLLIALLLAIPFFFYDIDESVSLTVCAAVLSMIVAVVWVGLSVNNGLKPERMPLAQPFSVSYIHTIGIVMLNLGCATVIPSWINIKSNLVRTQSVLWTTIGASAGFYLVIGIFFGLAFESNESNNSLQELITFGRPQWLARLSVGLYSFCMLLPGVPVNSIISQKNLVQNKICGYKMAIFLSYILPVLVCIPLQTGNYLFLFLSWTSLIFTGPVNFIIPLVIYRKCLEFRRTFKARVLSVHQLKLLSIIHSKSLEIEMFLKQHSPVLPDSDEQRDGIELGKKKPTIVLQPATPFKTQLPNSFLNSRKDSEKAKTSGDNEGQDNEIQDKEIQDKERGNEIQVVAKKISPTTESEMIQVSPAPKKILPKLHMATVENYQKKAEKHGFDEYARVSLGLSPKVAAYPRIGDLFTADSSNAPPSTSSSALEELNHSTSYSLFGLRTSSSAGGGLQVQSLSKSHHTKSSGPRMDELTFIDPHEMDIPDEWCEDLPNPDDDIFPDSNLPFDATFTENDPDMLDVNEGDRTRVSIRSGISSNKSSVANSLPRERQFKCPPFRAIPKWFPIDPNTLCTALLSFTGTLSIVNIILNIYFSS